MNVAGSKGVVRPCGTSRAWTGSTLEEARDPKPRAALGPASWSQVSLLKNVHSSSRDLDSPQPEMSQRPTWRKESLQNKFQMASFELSKIPSAQAFQGESTCDAPGGPMWEAYGRNCHLDVLFLGLFSTILKVKTRRGKVALELGAQGPRARGHLSELGRAVRGSAAPP